jgi:hypothetical protein
VIFQDTSSAHPTTGPSSAAHCATHASRAVFRKSNARSDALGVCILLGQGRPTGNARAGPPFRGIGYFVGPDRCMAAAAAAWRRARKPSGEMPLGCEQGRRAASDALTGAAAEISWIKSAWRRSLPWPRDVNLKILTGCRLPLSGGDKKCATNSHVT